MLDCGGKVRRIGRIRRSEKRQIGRKRNMHCCNAGFRNVGETAFIIDESCQDARHEAYIRTSRSRVAMPRHSCSWECAASCRPCPTCRRRCRGNRVVQSGDTPRQASLRFHSFRSRGKYARHPPPQCNQRGRRGLARPSHTLKHSFLRFAFKPFYAPWQPTMEKEEGLLQSQRQTAA